jgi:arginine decarboxylase
MTQSSLLLGGRGNLIGAERIQQALGLMYTSSASYPLMCSLDIARKQLAQNGRAMLTETLRLARFARKKINEIEGLTAFGRELMSSPGCFDFDETKLGVHVRQLGRSGCSMESLLRSKFNIQIELSDPYNILSVVTIADRQQDLEKLIGALAEIAADSALGTGGRLAELPETPDLIVSPREAFYGQKRTVELESSAGEISGEMIMAYPPGIPVICMGERITKEIIDYIRMLKEEKCELQGAADPLTETIRVLGPK